MSRGGAQHHRSRDTPTHESRHQIPLFPPPPPRMTRDREQRPKERDSLLKPGTAADLPPTTPSVANQKMGSAPEATPEPSFDGSDQGNNRSAEKGLPDDDVAVTSQSQLTSDKMSISQIPRTLLLATLYASISGLLFGYQLGVVGGALTSLQSSFDLSSSETESITSIFFIGLMIGSPFGGYACDRLGRRSSMLYMDGLFVLAAFVLTVAPNYNTLLAGRFIAGCASGVSLVAAVSYLTELASVEHHQSLRGALVTAVEWNIALGFLVSYLAAYALTAYLEFEEGWRLLFGLVMGLLAILQWMGMRAMPESPEWLAEQGFHDKAHAALGRITPRNNAIESGSDESLAGRIAEVEDEMLGREYGEVNFFMLDDCPPVSHYWKQVVIIAFLDISEQFCGHINILNYAPVIFAEIFYDYNDEEASENGGAIASELLTTTIILGVLKLIVTTFVLFQVDHLGRLFLMKAGVGIITVSLLFLASAFAVTWEDKYVTDSGQTKLSHSKIQHALVLIGCTGVVAGFALSYGAINWLITSELSPSSIRGRILGLSTVLNHGCAALVSYTFLSGQEKYGAAMPFWLYFFCSLASFAFILVALPETGGVAGGDGEDVESLLDDTLFWSKDNPMYRCCAPLLGCGGCKKNDSKQELHNIHSCFDDTGDVRRPSLTHAFV